MIEMFCPRVRLTEEHYPSLIEERRNEFLHSRGCTRTEQK